MSQVPNHNLFKSSAGFVNPICRSVVVSFTLSLPLPYISYSYLYRISVKQRCQYFCLFLGNTDQCWWMFRAVWLGSRKKRRWKLLHLASIFSGRQLSVDAKDKDVIFSSESASFLPYCNTVYPRKWYLWKNFNNMCNTSNDTTNHQTASRFTVFERRHAVSTRIIKQIREGDR